jgi:hypothetical protein
MNDEVVEYRLIEGWPGYRVGSDGSLWTCKPRGGKRRSIPGHEWREMRPRLQPTGYLRAILCQKKKTWHPFMHKLVMLAFVGPVPNGMECAHNDGNRVNNCLSNLRYDTRLNNAHDKIRHGTVLRGRDFPQAKASPEIVRVIRAAIAGGESAVSVGKRFGMDNTTIGRIARREAWSWVA